MQDPYPDLFRTIIKNSVTVTLERLNPDPDVALSAHEKERVLSTLDDALTADVVWSETWQLLDQAAPKMEMAGLRGEWVPFLECGIARAVKKMDPRAESRLAIHLGEMHRQMNQLEQSDTYFQRSLKISEKNGWRAEQGRALNRRAILALRKSRYVEAEQLSRSALDLLPQDHIDRANSYYVLGTVKYETGDSEGAIPLLKESCEIWKQSGSKRKYAVGLRNLGPALRLSGQFVAALRCAESATKIFSETGDILNQAIAQMNVGICQGQLGKTSDAIQHYEDAILIFDSLDDTLNLARAYGNMGVDFRELGHSSESERALLKSVEFAYRSEREFTICNWMLELWVTRYKSRDIEKAKHSLNILLTRLKKLQTQADTRKMAHKFVEEIEEVMGKPLSCFPMTSLTAANHRFDGD